VRGVVNVLVLGELGDIDVVDRSALNSDDSFRRVTRLRSARHRLDRGPEKSCAGRLATL